jgi:methionyl-tRNA formyltransferase
MAQSLLVLTGQIEARFIRMQLARPDDSIVHAATLDELDSALEAAAGAARLLAFCTAVIVPPRLLARLPGPGYNIHPGPPSYPGRHPESWGAYHGVTEWGATLHEMAPRVDEGAIVDVERIQVPAGAGQLEFGRRSLRAAVTLLARWFPRIIDGDGVLPRCGERWSGHKTTRAELEAMRRITPDMDEAEFTRRRRAFAEVAGTRLVFDLHGCEFAYTVPGAEGEPAA